MRDGGGMEAYEAIELAGSRVGVSSYAICKKLGKNHAYIATAKARGSSPSAITLSNMAAVCGYALALVPKNKLDEDDIVVER